MHALQGLLLNRLDAHRANIGCTSSLQQCSCVCRIGLVAFDVSADVLGGQQLDLDAQAIEPARPVVGRAAGFHDDQIHVPVGKPAFELGAGQALGFDHAPVLIGHSELKNRLCKIDGNSSSIHVGLLTF